MPNRVVRDFCRSFNRTGVGYYPNSVFVHLDVRRRSTHWVDWSRPGEPPRYRLPASPEPDAEPSPAPEPVELDHEEPEGDPEGQAADPQAGAPGAGHDS